MLPDVPDLDTLVVSVGGGGLIAGMATAAKAIKPDIEIIGVRTYAFPGHVRCHQRHAQGSGGISEEHMGTPGKIQKPSGE